MAAALLVSVMGVGNLTAASILPLLVAMVVCMAFGAGVNMAAESLAYRRLRSAPKLAPLMAAVGISFIFRGIAQQEYVNGSAQKNWPVVWAGPQVEGVFVIQVLVVFAVTVPLLVAMTYIVSRTRMGKAMRAVAQDQDGARLMGINVNGTISFTFGLGGALAGAAGVMYFLCQTQTYYDTGTQLGLIAFTAAVLGGIGNLTGAVLAAWPSVSSRRSTRAARTASARAGRQTVVFLILIVLMVFKPEGIFGRPTTEKV